MVTSILLLGLSALLEKCCHSQNRQISRSSHCGAAEMNPTSIHEDAGSIHGLSVLRVRHCLELWCHSQIWLRSGIAVAVV